MKPYSFQNIYNFRDIGGYPTKDGGTIKYGCFYRSGNLANLTNDDLEQISKLGIRTIIDLRSSYEVDRSPDHEFPDTHVFHLDPNANASHQDFVNFFMQKEPTVPETKKFMTEVYLRFITGEGSIKAYEEMFRIISNPNNLPVDIHCQAGKDRTGYGIALIMAALGASDGTIMEEYLHTNIQTKERLDCDEKKIYEQTGNADKAAVVRCLNSVCEEYLNTVIQKINAKYGSLENYLKKVLLVTDEQIERLRALYLE